MISVPRHLTQKNPARNVSLKYQRKMYLSSVSWRFFICDRKIVARRTGTIFSRLLGEQRRKSPPRMVLWCFLVILSYFNTFFSVMSIHICRFVEIKFNKKEKKRKRGVCKTRVAREGKSANLRETRVSCSPLFRVSLPKRRKKNTHVLLTLACSRLSVEGDERKTTAREK